MPLISKLSPQKRKNRVNVYLEGKFAFGLPLETAIKHGLKTNQKISQEKVEELIGENELDRVFNLAHRFLSYRPRSEREMSDYLAKKKIGEETTRLVMRKLKKQAMINDTAFVRWWAKQREEFRPRGPRMIVSELYQKGVPREIIEEVLPDEIDEKTLAKRALTKVSGRFNKLKREERRAKLSEYLARRGFSWEIIREVVDEEVKEG